MFHYKVKAHPTMYNGVQYRSRLEARWAAFFDLAGWKHEYEPIDLPGWSPDFILHGKTAKVLVEVKPVYEFPKDVADKIDNAIPCDHSNEVLIIGLAPFLHSNYDHHFIGWLRDINGTWDGSPFTDYGRLGFCSETQSFQCRMSDEYWGGCWTGDQDLTSAAVESKWRQAGNIVQWKKPVAEKKPAVNPFS